MKIFDTLPATTNLIGKDTKIKGKITCTNDMNIEGEFTGTITSTAKVIIGNSGVVKGHILSENADVWGEVDGEIKTNQTLSLKSTANVKCQIMISKFEIESGGKFNGVCVIN